MFNKGTSVAATGYEDVAQRMRTWIVGNRLAPGTPLPKQTDLAKRFSVSNLTVGRAMRQLQDDGFIVAIRRAGSFVAPSPPHLRRYALVFSENAGTVRPNRFVQALANEAARVSDGGDLTIDCYYGIDGNRTSRAYRDLCTDIERQRLAGILFASPPHLLVGTPIFDAPTTPRAAILPPTSDFPDIAPVSLAVDAFAERAFQHLRDEGRHRVAVIASATGVDAWEAVVREQAPAFGLEHRPHWVQALSLRNPECARRIAHLLFHRDQTVLPDALIVTDDNLLEAVSQGLLDAGIEMPRVLSVVAHANFPWPTPSNVPVCRLGFDAGEVLRCLVAAVERQRHGAAGAFAGDATTRDAACDVVRPLFEAEYHARRPAGVAFSVASMPAG